LAIRLLRVAVPCLPELHGVLEAQGSWQHIGQQGGLRHDEANQVVVQQVNPHFFFAHLRGFASQHNNKISLRGSILLDVAKDALLHIMQVDTPL